MSDEKSVSVQEAKALLDQGHQYVDVRSEPEFEAAHVPGALNVPISHKGPSGMQPNPDFLRVMENAFPKDAKLVLGCRSGARSKRALAILQQAGFTELVEMGAGFDGGRDAFGRPLRGWTQEGLPTESGKPTGRSYADIQQRLGK